MPALGTPQLLIGVLFLLLALSTAAVLALVARQSRGPALAYAEVTGPGYALRRMWFLVVLAVATGAVIGSLFILPYPSNAGASHALAVPVIGRQYFWQIATTTFRAGQTVNFAVTSADVNHGFGLYDPQGVLVAQVQAMPGYVNHLIVTLSRPGTYIVRCMEYCGLAHHVMEMRLTVTGRPA
jgi:cytochrome c oxidase subunit 2